MKEKIGQFIFPNEEQLESKWWHRLFKVFMYISVTIVFFSSLIIISETDPIILTILASLIFSLILYLFLNIIYYRIILYIIYGKNKFTQSWSIKKIGAFILVIIFLVGLGIGINSFKKDSIDQEQLMLQEKWLELGKEIEIENIEIQNMGSKYCKGLMWEGRCANEITTEGKFIKVRVGLKNISKKNILVSWELGVLIDNQEREYLSYDKISRIVRSRSNDIAPGFSDTREEIYEIPLDSMPSRLEIVSLDFEKQLLELK